MAKPKDVRIQARDRIEVRGVKELSAALRSVDRGLPKELQKGFKEIADHVVGVAQQKMPYIDGTAAKALKPRAEGRGTASIAFPAGGPGTGKEKDAYYPWLDFGGGMAGVRGITSSSPIAHARHTGGFKRPVKRGGRYLYPAIAESTEYISAAVDDVLERLIRANDLDTEGHV